MNINQCLKVAVDASSLYDSEGRCLGCGISLEYAHKDEPPTVIFKS